MYRDYTYNYKRVYYLKITKSYLAKPVSKGIVIEIAGKYVIKNITIASTAKKGSIAFAIVSTLSPDTDEATNKTRPIGGVANPTVKLTDIIIAK